MKVLFIILAIAAIPLVFFTMYSRTSRGIKIRLGSFFIMRRFKSDYLKVRDLKDIPLLLVRLCFAALIILLIINPSDVEAPGRNTLVHETEKSGHDKKDKYTFELIAPAQAMDRYDEDRFFLDAFVKDHRSGSKISIIYNPSERMIEAARNDIILFPSKKQARNAFLKWIEFLDVSPISMKESKIKDTDIDIKAFYPLLITDSRKVNRIAELENGSVIAASFEYKGRRILLFGAGLSGFWGDMGVSGYFIDIIDSFISNISLSGKAGNNLQRPDNPESGQVNSILSFHAILIIASFVFLIELIVFTLKSVRGRKAMLIIFLLLAPAGLHAPHALHAEDFKFIELSLDGQPGNNKQMFSVIKRELEDKTSIRISPDFYNTFSAYSLMKGELPEFPCLWIIGCIPDKLSGRLAGALSGFIEKGGIVFADLHDNDSSCYQFFRELGLKISGDGLVRLPRDHPVYKSFYLIFNERFSGVDVSVSTKRTALIICENNLKQRILGGNANAIKSGVNIVLYMLSGNYKSDQIHTRQILNRLKKRELFR